MKLVDNFNGWQASHSSRLAVAYCINVQIGNAQIGNIKLGNAEWNGPSWSQYAWGLALFPGRSRLQFFCILQVIKNWRRERPGNEATWGRGAVS